MAQYDFQIADYERIFRKRFNIVIGTIILAVIFSILFARVKTPLYSASASVKVDRNSVMGLGMEAVIYGTWDNIETQTKVITSFPVVLRAAKRLNLIDESVSEETDGIQKVDERVLSILQSLRSKVVTSVSAGTNIISISVTSEKPHEAKEIANAMALAYKEFSLYGKQRHAQNTIAFVDGQLDRCREDLSDIEHSVREFEESQKIPSIDENTRHIINKSSDIEKELKSVDATLAEIEVQRRKLLTRTEKETVDDIRADTEDGADSALSVSRMGWVSRITEGDPGLVQLNNRLIQLQIQRDDQLAYFKEDHPSVKKIEDKIRETIAQIVAEYANKTKQMVSKKKELVEQKDDVEREMRRLPANEMRYARLIRERKVQEELNTMLTKKRQEAMIAREGIVDDVTIMSMATQPQNPINKNMGRVAGVGVFLGLMFGIIFAIIREMFDTSIGTIEDVERTLKLAVLAVIPHIAEDQKNGKGKQVKKNKGKTPLGLRSLLVTHFNPKDPTAEAYRILRTNLDYLSFEKSLRTMLVTSATMQEGKSTTIANLAVAFAQQGKKVLLLECNLRRPSLPRVFGVEKGQGTSDILIQKAKWQDCVRTVTDLALGNFSMQEIMAMPGLDNFNIIPYGHRPPNPTELLSSKRMTNLLAELKEYYDIVLVDAPPLLPVADSIVLSTKVDGVVLVYMVGKAPRNSLRLAKERLEAVQAKILGLILNDIRPETAGITYSSYYMYAYTKDSDSKRHRSHS